MIPASLDKFALVRQLGQRQLEQAASTTPLCVSA